MERPIACPKCGELFGDLVAFDFTGNGAEGSAFIATGRVSLIYPGAEWPPHVISAETLRYDPATVARRLDEWARAWIAATGQNK